MSSGDYYLAIGYKKSKLSCLFCNFDFLNHFSRKMDVATTLAPKVLVLSNPTKKFAYWADLFIWANCYLEFMFLKFSRERHLLPLNCIPAEN